MEFYISHLRKKTLREFLAEYQINPVLGVIFWCLMKLRIANPQKTPFVVFRSTRETLIDLDQIDERYRSDIETKIKMLHDAGFPETLLGNVLLGSNKKELKQVGVNLIACHQEKRMAVLAGIRFYDEDEEIRMPFALISFLDDQVSVSSLNTAYQATDLPDGSKLKGFPDLTLTEMIEAHQQWTDTMDRDCLIIEDNEEFMRMYDVDGIRDFDAEIKRGIIERVYPE